MNTIYRVTLGGLHDVKSTLSYEDAKRHFLVWVEELSEWGEVTYNSVTLSADHVPVLEYIKK